MGMNYEFMEIEAINKKLYVEEIGKEVNTII